MVARTWHVSDRSLKSICSVTLTVVVRLYFYTHLMRLAVKKPTRVYLEIRQICFCELGRIDHGDLRENNFEDD